MTRKNPYFKTGLTVFLTVAAILLFYDTLFGNQSVLSLGGHMLRAIQPILIGALIAYLLSPVINFFEHTLISGLSRRDHSKGQLPALGLRAASLFITWLLICGGFYLLASFLLPELYQSVIQLLGSIEDYYTTLSLWVQQLMDARPDMEPWVLTRLNAYYEDFTAWLTGNALPQVHQLMSAVSGGIVSTLVFLKNLVVGLIVSVYFLATKERCAAFSRKTVFALLPRRKVYWLLRGIHKVDDIFSSFVRGKLLDSLIIGVICFFCCTLMKMPYTALVSVIIGVTNVIPFFGPFLGAIPSLFLILLAEPMKALYFLIFVIALQQVDGNIIGPKILGGKTGLSSLWVIIAILVGGSFFGVPGMFFGVPVCACLLAALNFLVGRRLREDHLPEELSAYTSDFPERAIRAAPPASTEEEIPHGL